MIQTLHHQADCVMLPLDLGFWYLRQCRIYSINRKISKNQTLNRHSQLKDLEFEQIRLVASWQQDLRIKKHAEDLDLGCLYRGSVETINLTTTLLPGSYICTYVDRCLLALLQTAGSSQICRVPKVSSGKIVGWGAGRVRVRTHTHTHTHVGSTE